MQNTNIQLLNNFDYLVGTCEVVTKDKLIDGAVSKGDQALLGIIEVIKDAVITQVKNENKKFLLAKANLNIDAIVSDMEEVIRFANDEIKEQIRSLDAKTVDMVHPLPILRIPKYNFQMRDVEEKAQLLYPVVDLKSQMDFTPKARFIHLKEINFQDTVKHFLSNPNIPRVDEYIHDPVSFEAGLTDQNKYTFQGCEEHNIQDFFRASIIEIEQHPGKPEYQAVKEKLTQVIDRTSNDLQARFPEQFEEIKAFINQEKALSYQDKSSAQIQEMTSSNTVFSWFKKQLNNQTVTKSQTNVSKLVESRQEKLGEHNALLK